MKKVIIICSLLICQCFAVAADELPPILSETDVQTYKEIFDLQDKGKFDSAKKLEKKLENQILMGDVLYQRLMSNKYYARGIEVAEWMKKYPSNPGADIIFKLSKKKKILARGPALPALMNIRQDGGVAYSESTTTKKYYGTTGSYVGQFLRAIKKRNTKYAGDILKNSIVKKTLSWTDYGRLAGRLAFTYYNGGYNDQATEWGTIAAERNSEFGLWTMGLLNYKTENFADAQKYFEKMLDLSHINTNRKVEAAFWAGRAARAAGSSRAAKKHWRFAAAERPTSFYGALSASELGDEPDYEFYEATTSNDDIAELTNTKYGTVAIALLQIGKRDLAENHLKYLITKRASDALIHAVHALAVTEELPRTALAIAPVVKDRGILEIDQNMILSAQYPLPDWKPRGGWNVDRALLFAIARQESRFKANAKSHAGATGLLQLMPKTAKITARRSGTSMKTLDLKDPSDSMFLGQQHVLDLFALRNVDNNIIKMLVSYNAGNGSMRKFERRFETDDPLLYIESYPTTETRQYVKLVMSNLWLYRARLDQPLTNLEDLASGKWPMYDAKDNYANLNEDDSNI